MAAPPRVDNASRMRAMRSSLALACVLLLASTVAAQQWAYLDHDARLTARALLDQFPGDIMAITASPID